jgi:hypothetical protein
MLMCVFLFAFAHETSGAARTRSSLRPLFFGRNELQNFGRIAPRECGGVPRTINVIARSTCDEAIQFFPSLPWIASLTLAMTMLDAGAGRQDPVAGMTVVGAGRDNSRRVKARCPRRRLH